MDLAALQGIHHVFFRLLTQLLSRLGNAGGVSIQLRHRGQPAHLRALEVAINIGAAVTLGIGQRRAHVGQGHALVAPLVGVLVEEAGGVHLARGGNPILRERELRPPGLGANLLLAHVMAPTAARDAHRAAQHEDVHDAAISVIGLVPLVETGAHQHAGAALGIGSRRCEFARKPYHILGGHAGYGLLPSRGEGNVVHLVGGHLATDAAIYAQIGSEQVEHRGNDSFPIDGLHFLHRHCAMHHRSVVIVALEQRNALVPKIGHVQCHHRI